MHGQTVQYTLVDNEALKEAQKQPEKYKDLLVRSGGYNEFSTELAKETHDSIIARTEYNG